MNNKEILTLAHDVFNKEVDAISQTKDLLGEDFIDAVRLISECNGKVITMGIGKSGVVGRKIAATLTSTGTNAIFVHPVECLHGDLGIIRPEDIVLILSKSGESDEIRRLFLYLKNLQVKIIGITSRKQSYLAKISDITLVMADVAEACPMGLAPMSSTTVQMVIGDALAAVIMQLRNFQPGDFALFHPAGSLGKQLLLKVEDVMHSGEENPVVVTGTLMRDALVTMTSKAMGAILIVDNQNRLIGILTDGDLRRAIQKHMNILELPVDQVMTKDPICVHALDMAIEALHLMEKRASQINVLPVLDQTGFLTGILRLHDLIISGL